MYYLFKVTAGLYRDLFPVDILNYDCIIPRNIIISRDYATPALLPATCTLPFRVEDRRTEFCNKGHF